MSPELITAVKERLSLGHPDEQISNELRGMGYDDETIHQVIRDAKGEGKVLSPFPPPEESSNTPGPSIVTPLPQAGRSGWLSTHLSLLVVTILCFVVFSLFAFGWMISTPTTSGKEYFDKIIDSIMLIGATLQGYFIFVLFSTIRYRKTYSYKPVKVATLIALILIIGFSSLYKVNVDKYREINESSEASLLSPGNSPDDYICNEANGDRAFFSHLRYTTVRSNGSYSSGSGGLNFSTTSNSFFIAGYLGANYQHKSEEDKVNYLRNCLNSEGDSILEKYSYKSPHTPPLGIFRSDPVTDGDEKGATYTLVFTSDNVVTFAKSHLGIKSSDMTGEWIFMTSGDINILIPRNHMQFRVIDDSLGGETVALERLGTQSLIFKKVDE